MQGEMECEGQVSLGPLPWDISEQLAQFKGNWLEFSPRQNAIIVRKSLPVGCPATTAVSCELITLIESLTPELRQAMPGGEFFVRANGGRIMRFAVEKGEIRIQWPNKDYSHPIPVSPESAMNDLKAEGIRIEGWARFAGASERVTELRAFVARFDGLFPEEDMPSECEQNVVFVRFNGVEVDPDKLVNMLKELADPIETLEAELEIQSRSPRSEDKDFRILIDDGQIKVLRPSLW
jgi:hypothetical protein